MRRLLFVVLIALSFEAHAVMVTYEGNVDPSVRGDWNVTLVMGRFDELSSRLTKEPWYGNGALATEFALLVGDSLGFPNPTDSDRGRGGPIFASQFHPEASSVDATIVFENDPTGFVKIGVLVDQNVTWATVPEPATFGMLGAGLIALGVMRHRRDSA